VHLRDGRRGTGRVRNARGNPDQPLTAEEVMVKFRGNVGDLVPHVIVDEALGALLPAGEQLPTTHTVARLARVVLDSS
jgi:hypothetical protein